MRVAIRRPSLSRPSLRSTRSRRFCRPTSWESGALRFDRPAMRGSTPDRTGRRGAGRRHGPCGRSGPRREAAAGGRAAAPRWPPSRTARGFRSDPSLVRPTRRGAAPFHPGSPPCGAPWGGSRSSSRRRSRLWRRAPRTFGRHARPAPAHAARARSCAGRMRRGRRATSARRGSRGRRRPRGGRQPAARPGGSRGESTGSGCRTDDAEVGWGGGDRPRADRVHPIRTDATRAVNPNASRSTGNFTLDRAGSRRGAYLRRFRLSLILLVRPSHGQRTRDDRGIS